MPDPHLPSRLEAEVERITLNDDYPYLTTTIKLADGRRMTVDFERDSAVARNVLEALAEGLPRLVSELHDAELLVTRLIPADADDADD